MLSPPEILTIINQNSHCCVTQLDECVHESLKILDINLVVS
jgi:hypothetical protein